MTKDALITYIQNLDLPEGLKQILLQMVHEAPEVTDELLNAVADVLDEQAAFLEKEADVLEEQAESLEDLQEDLSLLEEEEYAERAEAVLASQESIVKQLQEKQNTVTEQIEETQVSDINAELKQMGEPSSAAPVSEVAASSETPAQPPQE